MEIAFQQVIEALRQWCQANGIQMQERSLPSQQAGEFTGTAIVMNRDFPPEDRLYYLVHALGSIVRWSLSRDAVQRMFDELRDAKEQQDAQPQRFARAVAAYRAFETESSEFAVWLLREVGHAETIPAYTIFMRADLESMTQFHRTGHAPKWGDFFRQWRDDVAAGRRRIEPYQPKPIPPFQPVTTERQEILQR
jgi:hypothetical protein